MSYFLFSVVLSSECLPVLFRRFPIATLLGSIVAVAATLASGEYQSNWYYLLIDAVLVIAA